MLTWVQKNYIWLYDEFKKFISGYMSSTSTSSKITVNQKVFHPVYNKIGISGGI